MTINKTKLLHLIHDHNIRWINIKTVDNNLFAFRPLKAENEISTAQVTKFVKEFIKDNTGTWIIEMKGDATVKSHKMIKVTVDLDTDKVMQGAPVVDTDALRADIKAEIMADMKQKEKEELRETEIKDLKGELKKMQDTGGKLAWVVERVGTMLFEKFAQKNGAQLAGTPEGDSEVIATGEVGIEALNIFLKYARPEFILAVAKEVDKNPDLLNQLKTVLNINVDVN